MKTRTYSPVYIVGAGPGNPDLLTIKAHRKIIEAEVILHDNLVPDEIINLNPTAEKIYVGRKYGERMNQLERQKNINNLLVQYHLKGKKVVRLKSGDPYIYGRASEETAHLNQRNIPFEIVAGITSAMAGACEFNIPITRRNASNAVLICTGHTADNSLKQLKTITQVLKDGNTVAIYMGVKHLEHILKELKEHFISETIIVYALSQISQPHSKKITGTLDNINEMIAKERLPMPIVLLLMKAS